MRTRFSYFVAALALYIVVLFAAAPYLKRVSESLLVGLALLATLGVLAACAPKSLITRTLLGRDSKGFIELTLKQSFFSKRKKQDQEQ